MTLRRPLCAVALLLGLALVSPAPAATAAAPPGPAVLTSVTATHTGTVDKVVFRFSGGVPDNVGVQWVDTLFADGSGLPVRVAGDRVLSVALNGAVAHDDDGATVTRRATFALPNVLTSVQAGDFEGTVLIGLGVQRQTSYRVRTLGDRVVVKVGADFPTVAREVFFADRDAEITSVSRRVPASAPAAGALHALFAGPLPAERADGLRLVRSGAWGFRDLRIADGIARVRLTPGVPERRVDHHGRERDRTDASAAPERRLGQGLRPRRRHRAAHRTV